jgi:hypothetical protein
MLIVIEKLPPRVSQTSHWLDITTILRQNGYVHFALIVFSQTVFGSLNEVGSHVASPICFNFTRYTT